MNRILCLLSILSLPALGQLDWDVQLLPISPGSPPPATPAYTLYRGESLTLRPRYLSGSTPWAIATNATVALWWQTNGMAGAYYALTGSVLGTSSPGRVSITWPSTQRVDTASATAVVVIDDGRTRNMRAQIALRFAGGYPTQVLASASLPDSYAWTRQIEAAIAARPTVADVSTTITARISAHTTAIDPHADRSYADAAATSALNVGRDFLCASGAIWRTDWQTAAGASAEVARITATNQAAQSVASAYLPLTGGVVATLSVTNGLWLNSFDLTKSWQIKATTNGDWLYLWTPETGRWAFPDLGPVARTVASTYDLSLITAASLGAAEVSVVATQIWDKSQYPDAVWLEDAGVYFATAEQGAKADAALTNAAQFVAMAGNVTRTGTLGGNNAVVSSDYVTLAQQQASIQSGIVGYWTTNRNTVRTNGFSKPLMVFSCTNTAVLASGTINIPTTSNGEYVVNLICTDKSFTSLQHGTVDVELWMNENVAGSASITAEFYAYDTVRNTLSAFEGVAVLGQAVPAGATVGKLLFSIPYGDLATTNLCYPVIRLKLTALSGTPTLVLSVENGTPSHFSMTFPTSELLAPLEARVTAVETGVAAVSNATFGAWSNATVI
ncbi:MAG: hypothetical protein WCG26_00145, partial [Chloroflexales bacterium]